MTSESRWRHSIILASIISISGYVAWRQYCWIISLAVVTKEICANNFKYRVHPIIGRNQNRPCLPSFSQTRQRWGTEYVFLATIVACMPKLNTIFQNNFILHHRPLASCLNFVIWAKLPPIPSWMSTHWVTQVVEKNWLERRILSLILRGEYLLSSSPPHPPKPKYIYSNKMGLEMGKRNYHKSEAFKVDHLQLDPLVSFTFEEFPFPHFLPLLPPSCLCSIKKWFIMGGWVKRWNIFGTK